VLSSSIRFESVLAGLFKFAGGLNQPACSAELCGEHRRPGRPEDWARSREGRRYAFEGGFVFQFECRVLHKNGQNPSGKENECWGNYASGMAAGAFAVHGL